MNGLALRLQDVILVMVSLFPIMTILNVLSALPVSSNHHTASVLLVLLDPDVFQVFVIAASQAITRTKLVNLHVFLVMPVTYLS